MRNRTMSNRRSAIATLLPLLPLLAASAQAADAVVEALAGSKVTGNFRLRHEAVDVDGAGVRDAEALTLRSRLGIETAPWQGLTAIVEFEDTRPLFGQDDYAPEDGAPYRHAAIVDPAVTEVNRAYLRYRGVSKLELGLGRQRILYDNQRFVGNVGWRQDEQTFDAATVSYSGVPNWTFNYAYIDQVNGIASERPLYNFDLDSSDHLLNVAWAGLAAGKFTAYAYLLENDEPTADLRNVGNGNRLNPALRFRSNDTVGLRFDGGYGLPTTVPLRLLYTAEYTRQELTAPAGAEFDTDYWLLEAGVGYTARAGLLTLKLAREQLGSDDGAQGFQTPYATKHAFNGWADVFLNTPTTGLEDSYVTLAGDLPAAGLKAMAVYHRYKSDAGDADFGSELNLQLLKQIGPHYTLGVKYARYRADSESPVIIGTAANIDADKFWAWAELNF